ncbi:MAG: TrmH family RNA methyltransferase [Nanoarchaeota archaeon]
MKYLLILNRYDINKRELEKKIGKIKFEDNYRAIAEDIDIESVINLDEVKEIIDLYFDYKPFHGFRELCQDAAYAFKKSGDKFFRVETKFITKQNFSAKQIYKKINTYLKKEGFAYRNDGAVIYVEFNKNKYRVGIKRIKRIDTIEPNTRKFIAVLEKPESSIEISDFLRICYVFRIPLLVIPGKDFERILKKAKEETKGINYSKFDLRIEKNLPDEYLYFGFSKHGNKNERQLASFLKLNKKIALIFGNEKYGLGQELRDKLDYCFRVGPELKKPLRASHVLSYVLGFYSKMNLN